MNHQISIKAIDGFYYPFSDSNQILSPKKQKEPHWNLPQNIGQGFFSNLKLLEGFNLYFCDYVLKKNCYFNVECSKAALGFGFCVSGKISGKSLKMKNPVTTQSGDSQIMFHEQQTGEILEEKGIRKLALTITIEPEVFHFLVQHSVENSTKVFQKLTENNKDKNFVNTTKITPYMMQLIDQVFNCRNSGASRHLFMQSKAIELIALRLENLHSIRYNTKKEQKINPKDTEKIYYAAQILTKDLEHPPGLFDLAQTAGLSHCKLNRGFRSLFNTSVFGYLRRIRLQEAKKLLEDQNLNVTETAYAVGYNSISSFSRAFQKQYGLTPKAYMRQN